MATSGHAWVREEFTSQQDVPRPHLPAAERKAILGVHAGGGENSVTVA